MPSPGPYDHVRPGDDADLPDGVYRVVGTTDEAVTLLRVGAADGRRVVTGDVTAVSRDELEGFVPAENPDGNRPFGTAVRSRFEAVYWSLRTFGRHLSAQPLPTTLAAGVALLGAVGDLFLPGPDLLFGAALFLGSLGLAVVGSGRT